MTLLQSALSKWTLLKQPYILLMLYYLQVLFFLKIYCTLSALLLFVLILSLTHLVTHNCWFSLVKNKTLLHCGISLRSVIMQIIRQTQAIWSIIIGVCSVCAERDPTYHILCCLFSVCLPEKPRKSNANPQSKTVKSSFYFQSPELNVSSEDETAWPNTADRLILIRLNHFLSSVCRL